MRKKIRFYKTVLIEILETLCSICLYLDTQSRLTHNPKGQYMYSHFQQLKIMSDDLRMSMLPKRPFKAESEDAE